MEKRKIQEKKKGKQPKLSSTILDSLARVRTLLTAECRLLSIRQREETPSSFSALSSLSLRKWSSNILLLFFLSTSLSRSLLEEGSHTQNKKGKKKRLSASYFCLPPHERTTTSTKSFDFIIHRVDGVNRKKEKAKSLW